ncbi:class F sortase [Streptomyces sp. bgisy031]|uniref:class F sortase n=1 Tax=Streptomyces sp. bgisy031 TaxID=3413772 RepID=UPI003D7060B9
MGVTLVLFSLGIAQQTASGPPPQPAAAEGFEPGDARSAADAPALPALPAAAPTRVRIPAIGVDAPLTGLSLQDDGRLAAPPDNDNDLAGWYSNGVSPGSSGTAIVAGHVDIPSGPAVFYNLGALKKGMRIDITRADHDTAHFTIDALEVYDADNFPSSKVYTDHDRAELRLITCGGGYDKHRARYRGNVVVYAHLTVG